MSGGAPAAGSGRTSPAVVPITVNGTSTLTYWAVDGAGNASHPATARPSIVVRIDKIAPTFTVAGPTRAPNAQGWYDADVDVVFSASDAPSSLSLLFPVTPSFVTVTGEGVHPIVSTATDKAGNVTTTGVTIIRLDKTAPNLFNVFDPEARDVSVFARDLISGSTDDPLDPTVESVRWGGDKPTPGHVHAAHCDHGDPADKRTRAELRTFRTEDLAGNETILVEKVQRSGNQAHVKVLSYQFITAAGEGPIVRPVNARKKYEWSLNRDGSFKYLNQHMFVGTGNCRTRGAPGQRTGGADGCGRQNAFGPRQRERQKRHARACRATIRCVRRERHHEQEEIARGLESADAPERDVWDKSHQRGRTVSSRRPRCRATDNW